MKISDAGLAMIKGFEGFRAHAYQDIVGVWTIGYGETIMPDGRPVRAGDVLPEHVALERLRARCDEHFGLPVRAAGRGVLSQHQYDACVSLAYNIGTAGFATSTVAKRLRTGDTLGAGAAFLLWNKAGGRVVQVLVRRRAAERRCFDTGVYPA
ncbi:MAG: lysozyme [Pseudomonadota bacterium]